MSFVAVTIYISAFNLTLFFLARLGVAVNIWIVRASCFGISFCINRFKIFTKWYVCVPVLLTDIVASYFLRVVPISLAPENYALAAILLIAQTTIKTNLYGTVLIKNLKPGMILSAFSSAMMQGSRVRGLPCVSSEDLRNRLTAEEVESIQRWAASRKINELVIVKKIPFAFFISLGFICYFVVWGLVK